MSMLRSPVSVVQNRPAEDEKAPRGLSAKRLRPLLTPKGVRQGFAAPGPDLLRLLPVLLFLLLCAHQLNLPGLHYDEAKEAGLNALQLLTGQPVTAFREAAISLGPWRIPLMVQDYIGASNVLLALPFLAIGGINPVALRWLPVLTAALTLWLTWGVAARLGGRRAALAATLLLAVNPTFVFWSRQGIFVTNLTALLFMASLLTGLRWWASRRPADLWMTALLWGLGIYAKLLFVWAIGAMVVVAAGVWAAQMIRGGGIRDWVLGTKADRRAPRGVVTWAVAGICLLLPLAPLIWFNVRTSGTLIAIFGNLGRSYYGVDNAAYLPNLLTRLQQIVTLLRGDHLWYLGGVFANGWAPWLAAGLLVWALGRLIVTRRFASFLIPLALLLLIVAQSAFTVSDLFITHYALLLPLIPLTVGLAISCRQSVVVGGQSAGVSHQESVNSRQQSAAGVHSSLVTRYSLVVPALFLLAWFGGDLWTTARYHRALAETGGHAGHSDAINRLAAYLDQGGLSAPLALDWGMDAQVRFLTAGRVNPVELFGYAGLDTPDPSYTNRIAPFLANPANLYLAHAAEQTVFRGRVEALAMLAQAQGRTLREEARFAERSGRPLFVVYRVVASP